MNRKNIFIIADYGSGDPSFAEVLLQLRMLIPEVFIYPLSVPAFSTINTGFWIQQLALADNITDTYIYSNTAPRKEDKNHQVNNKGEKLMYAKLDNSVEVMAVNAGYVFSFIKPHIQTFHFVNVENEGSQFRSRDKYPKAMAQMVHGEQVFLGEKADIAIIPDYPKNVIASIDGYGNIKTTTRQSDMAHLTPGTHVLISLHGKTHAGVFTDGSFNIKEGELAFAPGSSGHEDKFMEVFLRGASAYKLFDGPSVEEELVVTPSQLS